MTRVTIDDFRRAGICPRARLWFQRFGLDWRGFVRNGIEADELRATGDNLTTIDRIEAAAKERLNGKEQKPDDRL